jgi:mono/diheme cytochrome c family protein
MRGVLALMLLIHVPLLGMAHGSARGKQLLTEKAYIKGLWPRTAYESLWKVWGLAEKPADYEAAVRERYGLHSAPYTNDGLPMGLRMADMLIGKGVSIDCMTCHGGSIFGKSMIGLPNTSIDLHELFNDLSVAARNPLQLPFKSSQVRGTTEASALSNYLLGLRDDRLNISPPRDLDLHADSIEDAPPWWNLKYKKTMYHIGATDSRSVRTLMQFMMHPLTTPRDFQREEASFRHIQAYLYSLEAPKYPLAINQEQAKRGEVLFVQKCATCHGTYGEKPHYPNKIIPLAKIGTDPKRFQNQGPKFLEAYNTSWFAQEGQGLSMKPTEGYQAPPLTGIWATPPYFHNGSVPTLEGVLNSNLRPKLFTRSFKTAQADYDDRRVGWKVTEVQAIPPGLNAMEKRRYYDTTQPGRGNQGHTYGDAFTDLERAAVIEYLKTL